jgi:hypothetical protein
LLDRQFLCSAGFRSGGLLGKHRGDKVAEEFISSERHEAQLYYRYKEYYGYVFYIGRKI